MLQIQSFKGGLGNTIFDDPLNKFASGKDLQIFNTEKILKPNVALVNDAGMPANFKPRNVYLASDGKYYFLGSEVITATDNTILYSTSTALSTNSTYTAVTNATIAGNNSVLWPLEEFKGKLYWGASNYALKTFDLASTVASSGATISSPVDFLKVHIGLGKLFYVHNSQKTIGFTADGTTFSDTALVLSANDKIVSIEPCGRYLLIGVVDVGNSKKAKILVWDGSATSVDDVVYLGETGLQGFRVVNGNIEAICLNKFGIRIYKFGFGTAPGRPEATLDFIASTVSPKILDTAIETDGDVLYFGLASVSDNIAVYNREIGLFGFGSNTPGSPNAINIDRLISTGVTTANIICVRKFGNTLAQETFVVIALTANSTFVINHNIGTTANTLSANGVYESDVFPLNAGLKGKIKKIILNHVAIPTSCGFTVQIKHFSNYPFGSSVPTPETYQTILGPQGNAATSGMTQSTNNATFTEIQSPIFKNATHVQIKILFDEIATVNAPSIVFPILIETE